MKTMLVGWLAANLGVTAGTLTFDQTTKEVRSGADAMTASVAFPFTNKSSDEVVIDRFLPGCSCIRATLDGDKRAYRPGESGSIRADFDLAKVSSTVDRPLTIWLKEDPAKKPSIILNARVIIPELVEVTPQSLIWEVGEKPEPKLVTVTMKGDQPIKVTSLTNTNEVFKKEVRTIEEGKKYVISVTPPGTDKVGMSVLHIETDCPSWRHRTRVIYAVVRQLPPGSGTGKAAGK